MGGFLPTKNYILKLRRRTKGKTITATIRRPVRVSDRRRPSTIWPFAGARGASVIRPDYRSFGTRTTAGGKTVIRGRDPLPFVDAIS